jgi:hypothetical protein
MQIIKKTKTLIVVSASAFISLSTQAYAATSNSDLCKKVTTTPGLQKCVNNNPIVDDLRTIINALSFGVGVIIIIMIILGGIQYMAAGDNPNGVTRKQCSDCVGGFSADICLFTMVNSGRGI